MSSSSVSLELANGEVIELEKLVIPTPRTGDSEARGGRLTELGLAWVACRFAAKKLWIDEKIEASCLHAAASPSLACAVKLCPWGSE